MGYGEKVWTCHPCGVESRGPERERACWACDLPMDWQIATCGNEATQWEISSAQYKEGLAQ